MRNGYYYGFDISAIEGAQSEATFIAKKAAGLDFIIHRASVGNDGFDVVFHNNVTLAQAAGLKVAAYNFLYPIPKLNPVQQAQEHFAALASYNPIVTSIDLEWPTQASWAKWGCTASQIGQWTLAYLQEYTQLSGGVKPWIYTYPNFMQTIGYPAGLANYPLWIASYEPTPYIPHPWNSWICWQFDDGHTDTIGGEIVDTDYCRDLSIFNVGPQISLPPATPAPPNLIPISVPVPAPLPAQPNSSVPIPDPITAPVVVQAAPNPIIAATSSTISGFFSIFSIIQSSFPAVANFILGIAKKFFSIK